MYVDMPQPRRRIAASLDSGTDYYSPSDNREDEDRIYEYRESVVTRTDTEEVNYMCTVIMGSIFEGLKGKMNQVYHPNYDFSSAKQSSK